MPQICNQETTPSSSKPSNHQQSSMYMHERTDGPPNARSSDCRSDSSTQDKQAANDQRLISRHQTSMQHPQLWHSVWRSAFSDQQSPTINNHHQQRNQRQLKLRTSCCGCGKLQQTLEVTTNAQLRWRIAAWWL